MKVTISSEIAANWMPSVEFKITREELGDLVRRGNLGELQVIKEQEGGNLCQEFSIVVMDY